jgi:hypothetical protein
MGRVEGHDLVVDERLDPGMGHPVAQQVARHVPRRHIQ